MLHDEIGGAMLRDMVLTGSAMLEREKKSIDALNVFPVPDGDTGTNMSMTVASAVREISNLKELGIKEVARALSSGSLKGARGNSGVILSQIFRGFAQGLTDAKQVDAQSFAMALELGVQSAYKAVMKPKEGTMLTVAKETAKAASALAKKGATIDEVMQAVCESGEVALAKTPDQLPVLKQAGVVDAGGKGLLIIYKGFLMAMNGQAASELPEVDEVQELSEDENDPLILGDIKDIRFGYCTEFFVQRLAQPPTDKQIEGLRAKLECIGDSIVVAHDQDLIKVHVHTNKPSQALSYGLDLGELDRVKIENMWQQNRDATGRDDSAPTDAPQKEFALVSVAMGDGFETILRDLSVDEIIQGGQTMNPSIEDINNAIIRANAKHVFVFPNNKNIVLAAQAAAEHAETQDGIKVFVVKTLSIPQGIGGVLSFHPDLSFDENCKRMEKDIQLVKSGHITYAVRDSMMDDVAIKEGNILGIGNGKLLESGDEMDKVSIDLLTKLVEDTDGVITIYYGQDIEKAQAQELAAKVEAAFEDFDVDVYFGGQPLYYYIFSVE